MKCRGRHIHYMHLYMCAASYILTMNADMYTQTWLSYVQAIPFKMCCSSSESNNYIKTQDSSAKYYCIQPSSTQIIIEKSNKN